MCVVSMIGDHYRETLPKKHEWLPNMPVWEQPTTAPKTYPMVPPIFVPTQKQFDDLKKDVEEIKVLLKKAKAYDEANREPDCEMDGKIKFLRSVAELVGIDLDEVFGAIKKA